MAVEHSGLILVVMCKRLHDLNIRAYCKMIDSEVRDDQTLELDEPSSDEMTIILPDRPHHPVSKRSRVTFT